MEETQRLEVAKLLSAGIPIREIAGAFGMSVSDVSKIQPENYDLNKFRHAQAIYPDLSKKGQQCVKRTHFAEVGKVMPNYLVVPRTDLLVALVTGGSVEKTEEAHRTLLANHSISLMVADMEDYIVYPDADIAAQRLAPKVKELRIKDRTIEELELEKRLMILKVHERDIVRRLYCLEPNERRYSVDEVAKDFLKPIHIISEIEARVFEKMKEAYEKS